MVKHFNLSVFGVSFLLLGLGLGLKPVYAANPVLKFRASEFKDPFIVEVEAKLAAHPIDDYSDNFLLKFDENKTGGINLGTTEKHGTKSSNGFSVTWTRPDPNTAPTDLTIAPFAKIIPGKAPDLPVATYTKVTAKGETVSATGGKSAVSLGKGTKLGNTEKITFGTTLTPDSQKEFESSWYDITIEVDQTDGSLKPLVNLGKNSAAYSFTFSANEGEIKNTILSAFVFDSSTKSYEVFQDVSLFTSDFAAGNSSIQTTSFSTNVGGQDASTETESVPEPLTILGATTAIGFGTAFKRRLAKVTKENKNS